MYTKFLAPWLICAVLTACSSPSKDYGPSINSTNQPPGVWVETEKPSEIFLSPDSVELIPGGSHEFIAYAKDTNDVVVVTWTVDESGGGTISTSGLYNAPADGRTGTFHVTAVVTDNSKKTAKATVNVRNTQATQVAAGWYFSCARTSSGAAECWGDNEYSQLGGATATYSVLPVLVQGIGEAVQSVSAGSFHACALVASGKIYCWGFGIGTGNVTGVETDKAVVVSGLGGTATAISVGAGHSCAVISDGTVKCWGVNSAPESTHGTGRHGQLGYGNTGNSAAPVSAVGITNATQIAAGAFHTCALLTTGAVSCWGVNVMGNLGDRTASDQLSPVAVQGLAGLVSEVTAGYAHTCARLRDGTAQCWGANRADPVATWLYGQVGSGVATASYNSPITVVSLTNSASIAAGAWHTCAAVVSGMSCWGVNFYGALGNGNTAMSDELSPISVTSMTEAPSSISTGYLHTCAVLNGGVVKCWGENSKAQLGDGTTTNRFVPAGVKGFGPTY